MPISSQPNDAFNSPITLPPVTRSQTPAPTPAQQPTPPSDPQRSAQSDATKLHWQDNAPPPPAPSECILAARQIVKSYSIGNQERRILDEVDFSLRPAECVFLMGPSGSGKTTLLSILGMLLSPNSGQLYFGGLRVDQISPEQRTEIRRKCIGFVFQRLQLINALDALDNVAIPVTLSGTPLSEARTQAAELLCRVGLESHLNALPGSMSPGQCQRVAMARAVIHRPPLVLADEPTAALDGQSGEAVMQLLRELTQERGLSTVVVTHDHRMEKFADRIYRLDNGRFQ